MTSIFLDDQEYVVSSRLTDIHISVIEKALSDLTNTELMSKAGFLLKFVVFTEKLPDEYIEKIEDQYIVFLEIEQLIDVYKTLQFVRTAKNIKVKQSKLNPESEEYKKLQSALDNISKLNQSLNGKNLIELGKKQQTDRAAIASTFKKALEENNQVIDEETLNKLMSQI